MKDLQQQFTKLESAIIQLRQDVNYAAARIKQLEAGNTELTESNKQLGEENKTLKDELKNVSKAAEKMRSQMKAEQAKSEAPVAELKAQVNQCIAEVEHCISLLGQPESDGEVLAAVEPVPEAESEPVLSGETETPLPDEHGNY